MIYSNIVKAEFCARPNRFVAECIVDGEKVTVHVKNTGRCRELLIPGCTVYCEDYVNHMGTRKLRYSLIAVQKGDLLINIDAQAPNRVVLEALNDHAVSLPGFSSWSVVRPETTFGDSRLDFYLRDDSGKEGFLEVKGVTLEEGGVASFPDAPTERGVKHLNELIRAKQQGYYAGILFIIQMEGIRWMGPNDRTHPAFGTALREAAAAGVDVLAYACAVTPNTLNITQPVPVHLGASLV